MQRTNEIILSVYNERKAVLREMANNGHASECLNAIMDLWMFMNRFRNCDLGFYYDEDINDIISTINPRQFDTTHLQKPKKTFRIAFVFSAFVDIGGASFPHRYILENPIRGDIQFEQYVAVTNLKNDRNSETTHRFQYLRERIDVKEILYLSPDGSWLDRGRQLEQWIYDREIDFLVINPDQVSLYAIASRPALLQAVLSPDCYTYTVGPGAADFTFLVTTDQVFKYKFRRPAPEKHLKIVMLPLPPQNFVEEAVPYTKEEFGLPHDAIVSATTNMWKSFFGDTEVMFHGLAALMRKHKNYYHLMVGSPRCADCLDFFLAKNPDLVGRIRFIGPISNIYRLLKMIDFYVNSFPTSGASDIESAAVGKPSIDLIANRNLDLHSCEFLRSRECDAVSLEEFVALGSRLIEDGAYRSELGAYLKSKILREFDKGAIVGEKIYDAFTAAFFEKLSPTLSLPGLEVDATMEYEKRIGLYTCHGAKYWQDEERWSWLAECMTLQPERPFAWIKSIEETIITSRLDRLVAIEAKLGATLMLDPRIQTMLALAYDRFEATDKSLAYARMAGKQDTYFKIAQRVAARLLNKAGYVDEAASIFPQASTAGVGNFAAELAKLPPDELPLFYNY